GIKFWPDVDTSYRPPSTSEEVRSALDKMKANREERWRKALQEKKTQATSANNNNSEQ
ncbi:hypothetical protein CU098_000675, partial [Rhizopus stolonifer]